MAKTTIASASRLGLGSLAGALLAGSAFAQPATPDINELLDPARVAASACGGLRYARNELFKPGVQLAALASPAAAVEASPGSPLPILDGLGPDRLQATTRSDEARALAAQGYAWLMGFNHRLAAAYFRAAQAADPGCAICYWGEAYALGPNINDAMHADAVRPAFQAMAMATLLIEGASPREQALIRALKTRYSMAADADRAALDQAYADAMLAAADAHPDDVELLVLAAEAVMNSQPWDYWEADGVTPKGRAGRLVALLETALAADPDHPHAIHLYIHTVEASSDPARAEPHADRLAALMPTAGHVVHMPAHIYYRVGRYQDSLATNIAAAEADEALFAEWQAAGEEGGLYRFGYYPHNVHFVLTSATMAGDAISAMAAAHKLAAVMSDEVTAEVAWVQAIRTAPFTATAQLGDLETVIALPDPGDAMPRQGPSGTTPGAWPSPAPATARPPPAKPPRSRPWRWTRNSSSWSSNMSPPRTCSPSPPMSSAPGSPSPPATSPRPRAGCSKPSPCRRPCPTWSRPTGTTRWCRPWPRSSSWPASPRPHPGTSRMRSWPPPTMAGRSSA
ncbi:MAG: hypothetical protein R3D28_09815 [Geminicoccaceae bacterium]